MNGGVLPGRSRHTTTCCHVMPSHDAFSRRSGRTPVQEHSAAALRWRESLNRTNPAHVPGPCSLQQIQHWPILSSWRWLVAIPTREASLSVDINLVQCLLLGLRHIRQEYQSRLSAWLALCRSTLRLQPEGYPSQKNLLQHLAAPIWTHGWQAPLVPGS